MIPSGPFSEVITALPMDVERIYRFTASKSEFKIIGFPPCGSAIIECRDDGCRIRMNYGELEEASDVPRYWTYKQIESTP